MTRCILRIKILFLTLLLLTAVPFTLGCTKAIPLIYEPTSPGVSQVPFTTRLVARYIAAAGQVWIAAPVNWTRPYHEVTVLVPGDLPRRIEAQADGSFLYKFPGDENSTATVDWVDPDGNSHSQQVSVTKAPDALEIGVGEAGLYPNRLYVSENLVWVINSGTDEMNSYDLDTLEETSLSVITPEFSSPWEAAFAPDGAGIVTTLFGGVHTFEPLDYAPVLVSTDGFRDWVQPNGVTILGDKAWVVDPNPLHYFPTILGTGWVSVIQPGDEPSVVNEIDCEWQNPQNVITDGTYIYVCCAGVIDFMPPDFFATPFTPGGVHVIDPATNEIVGSYELGIGGPSVMVLSPDNRYLYVGSNTSAWVYRIDLENSNIINDVTNPIILSDQEGTYVPFLEVSDAGLIAAAVFNTDVIYFIDSFTGEVDPFPVLEPIDMDPDSDELQYGPQDAVFTERNGEGGLLVLSSIASEFHWLPI